MSHLCPRHQTGFAGIGWILSQSFVRGTVYSGCWFEQMWTSELDWFWHFGTAFLSLRPSMAVFAVLIILVLLRTHCTNFTICWKAQRGMRQICNGSLQRAFDTRFNSVTQKLFTQRKFRDISSHFATTWAFRWQATCFKGMLTKAQLDDDVLPKIKLIWKLLGKKLKNAKDHFQVATHKNCQWHLQSHFKCEPLWTW